MTADTMTRVSRMGDDCSAIVTARAGQRSNHDCDPIAAPDNRAKMSVALSAPTISISELMTPLRNSDQAGAVFNIGKSSSNPVNPRNQVSTAVAPWENGVGFSSVLAGGTTQSRL